MLERLKQTYAKLCRSGIEDSYAFDERQRILLSNVFALYAAGFMLCFLPFYYLAEVYSTFTTAIFAILFLSFSIVLNARKIFLPAKFLMVITICALLGMQGLELGKDAHAQMMYLPLLIGMVAVFDFKKIISFSIAISIPIICIVLLEVVQSANLTLVPVKDEYDVYFYLGNLTTTILGSIVVIGVFMQTFRRQTKILENQAGKLEDSRESMVQTFQIARIGFSEVDLLNKKAYWGPGLKKIFGVSEDFVPSFDMFFEMVHPEDLIRIKEAVRRIVEEGKNFVQTYRVIRPSDKQIITLNSNGRVIFDCSGKPIKLHAVVRDITEERRQAEQIKQEKERAEAADLAKSLFLSNISHEIRTPLHGLLGFAKLLERTGLDQDQRSHLSMMQYSGETLMALLNDILDITRIEQGQLELKREAFALQNLIENCLAPYELQASEKGLNFSILSEVGSSEVVFADPLRIKQILVNLVNNAIKYTDRGRVKVEARLLKQQENKGMTLQLSITDTGPGIPQAFQEDVFHSFTQLNTDVPVASKGLGLGLAIVRNLVEFVGGTIELRSPWTQHPNMPGSRFSVSIPVDKGYLPQKLKRFESAPLQAFWPLKVLVAEDNEVNQMLIKMILEQAHFEVIMATNGKEAVEVVHAMSVDLVLMDVQMPVMDGYTAAREIRKYRPDLPILALSANAYQKDIEKSIMAGMNAHLSKPFKLEDLSNKIATFFPSFFEEKV